MSETDPIVSYDPNRARPTTLQYAALERTCGYFNERLFEGRLPPPLIILDRSAQSASHFNAHMWSAKHDPEWRVLVSEISLNPRLLKDLGAKKIAAALVHELTHLWQLEHGEPPRNGYHDIEWSKKMESLGLVPSSTGDELGEKTGDRMSQYVERGGAFARAFDEMPREWLLPFLAAESKEKKRDRSKTRFVCSGCGDTLWGKEALDVECRKCRTQFRIEREEGGAHV